MVQNMVQNVFKKLFILKYTAGLVKTVKNPAKRLKTKDDFTEAPCIISEQPIQP